MVSTAQAVPREYRLTFGCTRLQEIEYFCEYSAVFLLACVGIQKRLLHLIAHLLITCERALLIHTLQKDKMCSTISGSAMRDSAVICDKLRATTLPQ